MSRKKKSGKYPPPTGNPSGNAHQRRQQHKINEKAIQVANRINP